MSLRSVIRTPHAKSLLFALVFAPVALILLGSSMADVQAKTAIGQPLASVEGLIGMGIAAVLLTLVSLNCEESPAGMFLTSGLSVIVGAGQFVGFLRIPMLQSSFVDSLDMQAAVSWSLYPLGVTAITLGAALALMLTFRRAAHPQRLGTSQGRRIFHHRHAWVAGFAIPSALGASILLIVIAPSDTTEVAAHGLGALGPFTPGAAIIAFTAALLLGVVAFMACLSLTGPQLTAWLFMVLPSYMLWPLWTSITGSVVRPGASILTSLSMAAPVVATLGLVLGSSTIGIYWARSFALSNGVVEGEAGAGNGDVHDAPDPRQAEE